MSPKFFAFLLMAVCPFLLASNIIIGAVAVRTIEPFTLAFLRWGGASLVVLPFAWKMLVDHRHMFRDQWKLILLTAFMGMGISGSGVYMALKHTSATNGTLIYSSSPVIIILFEWMFRGRKVSLREVIGILLGFVGVAFIVCKGHLETLLSIRFSSGDLLFVAAAISWAIYTVLSKRKIFQSVPTLAMFAIVGIAGATIQIPFVIWENVVSDTWPSHAEQFLSLAGMIYFSSIGALLAYQYIIRVLGPSTAGLVMYLMPPLGILMAVVFLGEIFRAFHLVGFILVMSGVLLATFPLSLLKKARASAVALPE
ncbi:DMT family transporter [uncultured Cohaesibacter sp.]|uniref:DMT family transporter n=1 Tax=uncultured Cohaesibacter sp. TaxID=1002546 RepID=UPI0029C78DE7|nr:DMT family transporter [uncultured Cohaesibacter sp.]